MDYKDKYIKYKIKYLELKNMNNQIGSGKKLKNKHDKHNKHKKYKMDSDNGIDIILKKLKLVIIQNLDSGWNGDSYIVKNTKDELLVLKIERMDNYDEKNKFESEYYRQIDFDKLVAKKHPDKFMVLENHGIIENCVFIHSKTDEIITKAGDKRKLRFIRKNANPNCYYLLYKPVLDGTFKSVKNLIKNDEELLLDFLIQIIKSINIYRKLGFIHTDVNVSNIMFKKEDKKFQWYWIDYGNITNNKYPDSLLDIERKEDQPDYKTNMMVDLLRLVQRFCMSSNIAEHNTTGIQKKEFIKELKENHIDKYNKVVKYLPIIEHSILNHLFVLVFKILYPHEYSEYYKIEYDNKEQLLKNKILLCIKHLNDKSYDELINFFIL